MGDGNENLYETRTNLLSSENIIVYLWRRCEKTISPFKPSDSFGIETKEIGKYYLKGKEVIDDYNFSTKDLKNIDFKGGHEYNFEIVQYKNLDIEKNVVSKGHLVLMYKSDRKFYYLFELNNDTKDLHLIMKVKQKVGILGSFQTEMVYYY